MSGAGEALTEPSPAGADATRVSEADTLPSREVLQQQGGLE